MNKVEIAFSRGLRMDLKSKDIVLVVSTERGKMGDQAEILEHHSDAAAERRQAHARHGNHVGAEHPDDPARRALREIKQPEQ